ncbi:hypothetical protein CGI33_21095 [Vibrio parahaemolyticus]|nr:hypothetical protein CGI33_21095 [Vibrio parahaemolyticus]
MSLGKVLNFDNSTNTNINFLEIIPFYMFHCLPYLTCWHNAALRGEQRDATQLKPLCHKHKS